MLDQLLEYHETPETGDFVANVMKGVQRQQRIRRLVLWGLGAVGAAFGVAGVMLLSEPVNRLFSGMEVLPVSLGVLGAVAVLGWLLHEEVGLST